jgi:hypothetical protein
LENGVWLKKRIAVIDIFYRVVMPGIMIILLLGISSVIKRPKFMSSGLIDILTRVFMCFWFCIGYIKLPNIKKKYKLYPNIEWKKSDVSLLGKMYYSFIAIFFGVGITLVTLSMFNIFLPIFSNINLFLAIANGAIYAIPLMMQYEVLKV